MFADCYRNKRVFLTGHTGFKGSWLAEWLIMLGADVTGYSLPAHEEGNLFSALELEHRVRHIVGDVRDLETLEKALQETQPDYVFHLAAQPLVRLSYELPIETITTNVLGTAYILDALRRMQRKIACVIVTSDKCYENREILYGYREDDALGGHDPYSASKGAAEIIAHAYRRSYFSQTDGKLISVATARAGNVIGGGDWSKDRIVPDCIRSLLQNKMIDVRNPVATRPWQHVMEPLSGYLWLGALLSGQIELNHCLSRNGALTTFNFGPWPDANRTVQDLVTELLKHWPGSWRVLQEATHKHEAGLLNLAIDKAFHILKWRPVWNFEQCVQSTVEWYFQVAKKHHNARERTHQDLNAYMSSARAAGLPWANSSVV